MNKTWIRIVVVTLLAAVVAFWVYFDKQRQHTPNSSLIPPSTQCPPGR